MMNPSAPGLTSLEDIESASIDNSQGNLGIPLMQSPTLENAVQSGSRLDMLKNAWKSDSLRARFARGTVWSIAGAVISQGLTLIAYMITARILGKTGFGELGMINSTVGMFGTFAGFGLGLTTTKYVAEYRTNEPQRAGRVIALASLVAAVSAGLLSVAMIFFAPLIATHTLAAPRLATELRIGAFLMFLNTVNGVQTGTLSGLEAFKAIAQSNLARGVLAFPVIIGGVLLWRLPGAVLGLALASGIGWLINHAILRRKCRALGIRVESKAVWQEHRILTSFTIPAFLANAAVGPVTWIANTILVNQPHGYAELGVFSAANQWRSAMVFLPGLVGQVVLPMLSSLQGEHNLRSARKMVLSAMGLNAIFILPIFLPILFLSSRILAFYGPGFASQGAVLIVMAVAATLYSVETPVGDIIAASGKMWLGAYINLGWAFVLLLASWLLLRMGWGACGLAVAYLIAYAIQGISTFWAANKILASRARHDQGTSPDKHFGEIRVKVHF